jgi:hypothetical protein
LKSILSIFTWGSFEETGFYNFHNQQNNISQSAVSTAKSPTHVGFLMEEHHICEVLQKTDGF